MKLVKNEKAVDRAATKREPKVKEATAQEESAIVKDAQVNHHPSEFDVLVLPLRFPR